MSAWRVDGSPLAYRQPRDIGDGWAEVCARGDDYWFAVEWADVHEIDGMTRRARVRHGSVCGYGRGWVAQYWNAEVQAWFDLGDPLPTASDAQQRANAWMKGEEW